MSGAAGFQRHGQTGDPQHKETLIRLCTFFNKLGWKIVWERPIEFSRWDNCMASSITCVNCTADCAVSYE